MAYGWEEEVVDTLLKYQQQDVWLLAVYLNLCVLVMVNQEKENQ